MHMHNNFYIPDRSCHCHHVSRSAYWNSLRHFWKLIILTRLGELVFNKFSFYLCSEVSYEYIIHKQLNKQSYAHPEETHFPKCSSKCRTCMFNPLPSSRIRWCFPHFFGRLFHYYIKLLQIFLVLCIDPKFLITIQIIFLFFLGGCGILWNTTLVIIASIHAHKIIIYLIVLAIVTMFQGRLIGEPLFQQYFPWSRI